MSAIGSAEAEDGFKVVVHVGAIETFFQMDIQRRRVFGTKRAIKQVAD